MIFFYMVVGILLSLDFEVFLGNKETQRNLNDKIQAIL
jgi:hypothetical protein